VGRAIRGIELSSRTPSGESGIGRRRRSLRCSASLLDEGRGGRVTKVAGVGRDDWIDRERHQYRSMARDTGFGSCRSPEEGPRSSYLRGPFTNFGPCRAGPSPVSRRARAPGANDLAGRRRTPRTDLCRNRPVLWTTRPASVDDPVEPEVCGKKSRKTLVGLGIRGIELSSRTPSGESVIGRRRRSVRRSTSLLDEGRGGQVTGPPGSEATSDGPGASPVPVAGEPPDHGLAPGPSGAPPEGPL
jgi:hypothetical protein